MSPTRGRAEPLQLSIPSADSPPVAAAFLVKFDQRKGYMIAWRRSIPKIDLDGVEIKSLPSGSHNVKEDLVYFIHEGYAGISAFINEPAPESERNAQMLAVGALVPVSYGRLGKSWRHAEELRDLTKKQIAHAGNFDNLEIFWAENKITNDDDERDSADSSSSFKEKAQNGNGSQPDGGQRPRGISDARAMMMSDPLHSPYHPALSLPSLVDTFGPLLFPLYRAALLRKRILMVGEAPVRETCNYVYDLSVLSSVSKSLLSLLPIDGIPALSLRPLFSVGVQDISDLARKDSAPDSSTGFGASWIACTTDDVLATKPNLYDILIILPPPHSKQARTKAYPKLILSSPSLSRSLPKAGLKATQRDARRFITLRKGLKLLPSGEPLPLAVGDPDLETGSINSDASSTISGTSVVEPMSWSLMAYTSFIWWASSGEKLSGPREDEQAEAEQDVGLLATDWGRDAMYPGNNEQSVPKEVALVAYFHRLTSLIFTTISDAISRQDGEELRRDSYGTEDEDEEGGEGEAVEGQDIGDQLPGDAIAAEEGAEDEGRPLIENEDENDEAVEITQADMTVMGLDIWSATDRVFVEQLISLWWGRKSVVQGGRLDCCGVRVL